MKFEDSSQFRHECEVRYVARLRLIDRQKYVAAVVGRRGQVAGDRLTKDVAAHLAEAKAIFEMDTNEERAALLREIEAERGRAFAQGLRESAWELMQEETA